jgi:hypothetical protein
MLLFSYVVNYIIKTITNFCVIIFVQYLLPTTEKVKKHLNLNLYLYSNFISII